MGELFNSVRHSRAGVVSLVIDRGIILHQALRLPSLIISGSSLILSTHSKDKRPRRFDRPTFGFSFRGPLNLPHDKSKAESAPSAKK